MTMSFFGKLKNLHSGPPAPPRRTDDNTGWPQDEFDDEEGDMYEAPPCERPAVKVPQRQVQENVYLERMSSPAAPQRQAAPPPRPGKPAGTTAQSAGAPEIDRSEKPGRKKLMPPPPPCSVSAPSLASNVEEDVYLDPNEEQEDNDDLYLEPTAACPPAPRGQQTRIPPCPKPIMAPSPTPMAKPPVPRAKSNSFLPSVNEIKPAPPLEARQATLPVKIPPPTPSYKPPLPANLREAKTNPPNPPITDSRAVASSSCVRPARRSGHEDKVWFAGDCNRKTAEEFLLRVNKDGAFLIRHSSNQSPRQPYTLAVLYQQKVYNIPIRFLEEMQGYALGKEGKKTEEVFSNLDEMISHHKHNQLLLIDSKSQAKHRAYLTHPAHP
ncbi:SH2 domain-containing protein 6 isoform X2 [Nelusetta ayraudi]|uniref:SH2 domain-containing protein 6 isoform X2 n=1 Tax=Nelusetta ayraudi TaxID=303726 RepID=UPI003F703E0E